MSSYSTSENFKVLKGRKERILKNYTSAQYIEVLDTLLYSAAEPILKLTDWFEKNLAQILYWHSEKTLKKVTSVERKKFQTLIALFLACTKEEKIKILKDLRLDRNILSGLVTLFLEVHGAILEIYDARARKKVMDTSIVKILSEDLYLVCRDAKNYMDQYFKFKDMIVEKYTRLSLMHAQRVYALTNYSVDLDDIVQIHLMHVNKAIDKYDPNKGALTGYVQSWFMNARGFIINMAGVNSLSEEYVDQQPTILQKDEIETKAQNEESLHIRRLAKLVDPKGWGRLALGIEEILD